MMTDLSAVLSSWFKISTVFMGREVYHYRHLNHVRFLRSKTSRNLPNPGMQNRLEMFENMTPEDIPMEDLEELEYNESDFMNVHSSLAEHEREMEKRQHSTRVKILEKKYFKQEKELPLLTWEEREQICHLNNSNPEKWNVHTLSQSFPATESTINKILKAKWRPSSVERIDSYNKSVLKNWRLLYEGKLKVPEELKAHLAKFTSRKNVILPPVESCLEESTQKGIPKPVSSEFSSMISNKIINQDSPVTVKLNSYSFLPPSSLPSDEGTYVIDENYRNTVKSYSTLDMYRKRILKRGTEIDEVDTTIVEGLRNKMSENNDLVKKLSSDDFEVAKYERGTPLEIKSLSIPERIRIPSHLKGKGNLYKIDDCYYDVDGEFLYRVPGMDSK